MRLIDDGGIEFRVRVAPGSGHTRLVGWYGDRVKVHVAAAPERGKANRALRSLLADAFGVALADVEILRGASSPDKIVRVRGATLDALRRVVPYGSKPG